MTPLIVSIATFIGVTALVAGVAFIVNGATATGVEDRLAVFTGANVRKSKDLFQQSVLNHPLDTGPSILWEFLSKFGNWTLLFEQADTSLEPTRFLVISGIMAGFGAVIPIVLGVQIWAAPVGALMVGVLPLLWLLFRRSRRLKALSKQLPDALELVARALRAGHSLASGFNLVAEEMTPPIGKEFQRVFEEQNFGIPLEQALENMTQRIPNLDLRFFATAVTLQRQTGGDLAEILDKIGYLVRERFKIHGQVQALTGEGRLSGIVLLALPVALFLAVYKMNPDYVMPLFTDPMGRQMLVGGIIMQLLGALVIRKIINIKV
jgi:tight adherence protein B